MQLFRLSVAMSFLSCSAKVAATAINANMITNPGAESPVGASDFNTAIAPTGWTCSTGFSTVQYAIGAAGDLNNADSTAVGGGLNYFCGAIAGASGTASQTRSVADIGSFLDAGNTSFTVSAYLGGYSAQDDFMVLEAVFLNATSGEISRTTLPTVKAADRSNDTTLLQRSTTKIIPAGTRSVQFLLTATRTAGSYCDAYADNLSFKINAGPGDATLDGAVNFDDLLALAQHYGTTTGATWTVGDFSGDGAVNFDDLLTLAQHYGGTGLSEAPTNLSADWALARSLVPEPVCAVFVALIGAGLRRNRR